MVMGGGPATREASGLIETKSPSRQDPLHPLTSLIREPRRDWRRRTEHVALSPHQFTHDYPQRVDRGRGVSALIVQYLIKHPPLVTGTSVEMLL